MSTRVWRGVAVAQMLPGWLGGSAWSDRWGLRAACRETGDAARCVGGGAEPDDLPVLRGHTGQGLATEVAEFCDGLFRLCQTVPELGVLSLESIDLRDLLVGRGPGVLKSLESVLELHHTCTVDPVLMDPQPVGVAWLIYECPDCGETATSR